MKLVLAVALAVAASSVWGAGADDWLARASEAVRTSNYRGVLVYLRNGQMDTLRITHRFSNGQERERLVSLTGEPREIIRDGGVVTCVLPNKRVVLVARHSMSGLLDNVAELVKAEVGANYEVRDLGVKRLADRRCRSIAVDPQDDYRYGYHLLVDEETHLPLKLDLVHNGEILEQMMFTEIEFPEEITDAALQPTFDTQAFKWVRHQPADQKPSLSAESLPAGDGTPPLAVQDVWEVPQLPPGFRLAESGVRRVGNGEFARQMLFTDGVTTISLFIAPPDSRAVFEGGTTMGAVHAYGRQIEGFQATAVGEVPEVTVKFITDQLRMRPATAAAEGAKPAAPATAE